MNFSKKRPVKIVMLGAGGTGAHIAPHLYRLLYALERPVKFIICDGDKVEPKNLVRQNFTEADLGENKARVPGYDGFDVERAIPTSFSTEYPVDVDQLLDEVRYLNGFITAKTRKPIRFDGGTLSLETPGGTYLSKVGLPPVEARGLNPKYLLEGLEQFKAKKVHTVTMKMGHPHSPMILTDGKDDLAMVLPVRLKEVA